MRDPEDLKFYTFAGRTGDLIPGTHLRIELLALVLRGAADIESSVVECGGGARMRIFESPALLGAERCQLLAEVREALGPIRERYLSRQIRLPEYLSARNAALAARGTSPARLCEGRLGELLPAQGRSRIGLDRRVEIMAEVLRGEAKEHERREEIRRSDEAAKAESAFRRAAVRGTGPEDAQIPRRASVGALLGIAGLLVDVGAVLGTPLGSSGPSETQVELAIGVAVVSALVRVPFIAAVLLQRPNWRRRASFTIALLFNLVILGALSAATQSSRFLDAADRSAILLSIGIAAGLRLSWLLGWVFYLGLFRRDMDHEAEVE